MPEVTRRRAEALGKAFLGRLRSWMDSREVSQAELARRLGKSPAAISDWFTKGVLPEGETMLLLPDALKCSPAWLFYGVGSAEATGGERPELAEIRGAFRVLAELRRFVLREQDEWEGLAKGRTTGRPEDLLADVAALDVATRPAASTPRVGRRRRSSGGDRG